MRSVCYLKFISTCLSSVSMVENSSNMCENFDISEKYFERGDLIDSKIRKFFFKVRDKEVERDLRVTIRVLTEEINDDQKIIIELTNDSNPVFLFTLFITKNDFVILRCDQGINVDFKDFPLALVNLLDKCAEGVSSANGGNFKLILEDYYGTVGGGFLMDMKKFKIKILEECAFKNMCHLTLDVVRATDMQIQQKLETELCKAKQCLSKECRLHSEALKKISQLVESISENNKNIEMLNTVINNMKSQREEECREEQLQSEFKEKQLRNEYENKISQEQEEFKKKIDESQSKLQALEEEINRINEKQHSVKSQLLEKEKELEVTRAELTGAKQEICLLRNQNSKLDSDYHDKEKAVNILRTRLAVAEQELKDNNILLINHQKKHEESSKEKIDLQNNIDFIKNKLEKKESVVLNLSEELLKGNEIISKQQAKISILTAKLKEYEEMIVEKEKSIEEKDSVLKENDDIISKLQKELDGVNGELMSVNDKVSNLEDSLKEKNNKLENTLKVIAIMKENIQNQSSELISNRSQKSLLFYRAFLSTPSLLPSDDCRRMIELRSVLQKKHFMDVNGHRSDFDIIQPRKAIQTSNRPIIEPYLDRYSKRFMSIPSSLFRTSEVPMTVLTSPDGFVDSQYVSNFSQFRLNCDPFINSKGSVMRNTNEYLAFTMPRQFPTRAVSDSSLTNSEHRCQQRLVATCSTDSNDSGDKISNACTQNEHNPQYAPVGAFRFRPTVCHSKVTTTDSHSSSAKMKLNKEVKNPCLNKKYLRTTPAIAAPPLTQEQKDAKEVALKYKDKQFQKSQGHKTKEQVIQIPDPHHVVVGNSSEYVHNSLKKTSRHNYPGTEINIDSAGLRAPNVSKKIREEPEPSAYFIG